jgi:hypothetical protein
MWYWDNGSYYEIVPSDSFVMEVNEGYWVRAKEPNVYLSFPVSAQWVSLNKKTMFAKLVDDGKRWIKEKVMSPKEAIAESGDNPPMPMGGLDDESSIAGCFIDLLK